jgi:GMP synthase-like glutamine amidotransferase
MTTLRVLHVQNEITDPAGLFVEEFERRGHVVDTVHPYGGEPLPATLREYDAMMAGGGTVDTHQTDEYPWLAHEMELIREAVAADKPYLGLCLGAQLLTAATGGRVVRSEPPEVGWVDIGLRPEARDDPLFGDLPERFTVMEWHYYRCNPPEGAVELAANDVCTQALRVGRHAWGTQFHIEVTRPVLMTWFEAAPQELEKHGYPRDVFLRSLDERLDDHIAIGRRLAGRLADVAEAVRAAAEPRLSSGGR